MNKILLIFLLISVSATQSSTIDINPSIIGGRNATIGQFPYMVSIQLKGTRDHGCGGGILNNRWILSAAHCFITVTADMIDVVVGTVIYDEGGQVYGVEKTISHPLYIPNMPPFYTSNWNDIGLIKTKTPIIFNEFVQPYPLGRNRVLGNVPAVVAGFGAFFPNITIDDEETLKTAIPSRYLQFMDTRIITHADCSFRTSMFNLLNPRYPIHPIIRPDTCICTLQPRGIGTCFGDSGSMLISNGEIVGVVVSGVRICAQANAAPDIYARVSTYIRWIESYINEE